MYMWNEWKFQKSGALMLNGELVGYQGVFSLLKTPKKSSRVDISLEDYQYLQNVVGSEVVEPHQVKPITMTLVVRGDLLVHQNSKNDAKEFEFGDFFNLWVTKKSRYEFPIELQKLYVEYNKKYFNNELPVVGVCWNPRLSGALGRMNWRRTRDDELLSMYIDLSPHYFARNPQDLLDVLVHEMIHVKYPFNHHGSLFKREMNRLNKQFGLNISVYADEHAQIKYEVTCNKCTKKYTRSRNIKNIHRYYCGDCGSSLSIKRVG